MTERRRGKDQTEGLTTVTTGSGGGLRTDVWVSRRRRAPGELLEGKTLRTNRSPTQTEKTKETFET